MLSGERMIRLPYFAIKKEMEVIMNQIISYLIFEIMAIMGGGTLIFLVISLPAVIIWKIYRKISMVIKSLTEKLEDREWYQI